MKTYRQTLKSFYRFWVVIYLPVNIIMYAFFSLTDGALNGRTTIFTLEMVCWQVYVIDTVAGFILFPLAALTVDYLVRVINNNRPLNLELYGVVPGLLVLLFLLAHLPAFWATGTVVIVVISVWVSYLCGVFIHYLSKGFIFLKQKIVSIY